MVIKKSKITALTRPEFEKIVYNGMLSNDEATCLELWIKNVSVDETAEIMNYENHKTVTRLRRAIRRKLEKIS